MPMYDWKCECGAVITVTRKVENYRDPVICDLCGKNAVRVISAVQGFVKSDVAYTCPITGKPITTKKAHEENLARHGCRVYETGETENFKKKREAEETALENSIAETAVKFVEGLTSESREQLGRELESGLDVTVQRQ